MQTLWRRTFSGYRDPRSPRMAKGPFECARLLRSPGRVLAGRLIARPTDPSSLSQDRSLPATGRLPVSVPEIGVFAVVCQKYSLASARGEVIADRTLPRPEHHSRS